MSHRPHPRRVENYTKPFLVVACLELFMGFWVLASLWGFGAVLLAAAVLDIAIKYLGRDAD